MYYNTLIIRRVTCSRTEGATFVTLVCMVLQCVTHITYVPLGHNCLNVGNYIVVLR